MNGRVVGEAWVLIRPDGIATGADTISDSSNTERSAWTILLGWPGDSEVAQYKRDGYRMVRCKLVEPEPTT